MAMAGSVTMPGTWTALGAPQILGADVDAADGCRTICPGEGPFDGPAQANLMTTLDTIEPMEMVGGMPHSTMGYGANHGDGLSATLDTLEGPSGLPESLLRNLPSVHNGAPLIGTLGALPGHAALQPSHVIQMASSPPPCALQPLGTIAACSSESPCPVAQQPLPPPPPPPRHEPPAFQSTPPVAPAPPPPSVAAPIEHLPNARAAAPDTARIPSGLPSRQNDAKLREAWNMESVLEIFSASTGCWNVAHVIWVAQSNGGPDILTLQYYLEDGAKNKSLYRNDHQLAPFGAHTNALPPNCQATPSQSRPGQMSYLNTETNVKYETPEQVWNIHFERLSAVHAAQHPPLAPPEASAPLSSAALMPTPSFPSEAPGQLACSILQPPDLRLPATPAPAFVPQLQDPAELAPAFAHMLTDMQAHMGPSAAAVAAAAVASAPRDPAAGGKVALPSFTDQPTQGAHSCMAPQPMHLGGPTAVAAPAAVAATNLQPSKSMFWRGHGMNMAAALMGKQASACDNQLTKYEFVR